MTKLVNCKATTKVDFSKYFDSGKIKTLNCCLFAPHEGTHFNPRLLLTIGGATVKRKGWSAYTY